MEKQKITGMTVHFFHLRDPAHHLLLLSCLPHYFFLLSLSFPSVLSPALSAVAVMNVNARTVRSNEMILTGHQRRASVRAALCHPHPPPSQERQKHWDTPRFREDQSLSQRRAREQSFRVFFFSLRNLLDQSETTLWLCCHGIRR